MSQAIDVSEAVAPVKQQTRFRQFSLRGLLILMTTCCAILAMIAFPPFAVIAAVCMMLALFTFLVIASFYGRGWIRPFAIVAGLTMLASSLLLIDSHLPPIGVVVFLSVQIVGSTVMGLAGAVAHSILKRRSGVMPIPNIPFLKDWLYNPE